MDERSETTRPYVDRNARISVDVLISMKEELTKYIPHGLLSTITRVLYAELIRKFKEAGIKEVVSAALNGRLVLIISSSRDPEEE